MGDGDDQRTDSAATRLWDGLDASETRDLQQAFDAGLRLREELDRLPDVDELRVDRTPTGFAPPATDNPCNAWAWRCNVEGRASGPLDQRSVVLKDVISLGGIPLTGGSRILEGYVPAHDATVVRRVLEAGGTITGIATTEDLSFSGVSITSANGPVRNPADETRSAGGSSSGVAAVVASGDADVGIGADQGGSIRLPASFCGVFGLKPTYGLVPYTACIPIDPSLDHLGPIARTAADTALLLDVIAGDDGGRDPRQHNAPQRFDSLASLEDGVVGLRIGLLTEGFEEGGDERVAAVVRAAADDFATLGASVEAISVPEHGWALPVHTAVILQGAAQHLFRGVGVGVIGKGHYDDRLALAIADGLRTRSPALTPGVRLGGLVGSHLWDSHGGAYYAKAQNLARVMTACYDRALQHCDLLLMPTTPITAPALPDPALSALDAFLEGHATPLVSNTCAFNQTGHPALSIPVGAPDLLPVGLMIVGRRWQDDLLLRAAHALERAGRTRPPPASAS